jgi:hypothetical protein
MGERPSSMEACVEAALDMSSRPLAVETFTELFDTVEMAEIIGPDSEGLVWLSGVHAPSGLPRTVGLGPAEAPLAKAALRWRDARLGRAVGH